MKIETLASLKNTEDLNDGNFNDSEYLCGVIYAATTYGVSRWHVSNGTVLKDNSDFEWQCKAEALNQWNGNLIMICDYEFIMLNPKTNKATRVPLVLPMKNLLSQTVKTNILNREIVIREHEHPPHIWNKTLVVGDELYILMQYSETNIQDKNFKTIRKTERYSVVCVYDLPSLSLKKHYVLTFQSNEGTAFTFAVNKPFLYYNHGGDGEICRINIDNGQTETFSLNRGGNQCTGLATDKDYVYAFYGNDRDDWCVCVLNAAGHIKTIDLSGQIAGFNASMIGEHEKLLSKLGLMYMRDEDFKQHYGDVYNDIAIAGFRRAVNGNEPYFCAMDADICTDFGYIAIATELGPAPAFIWSIKTEAPVCYLFGTRETVVSRKIKVRHPYIISTAFEHLHLWRIV